MRTERIAAILVAALLATACGDSGTPVTVAENVFLDPTFDVAVEPDLVYGTGEVRRPSVGTKDLHLDLYRPDVAGSPPQRPGLVLAHGGGFTSGDKTVASMVDLATFFAQRGYVAVSIEYRLTGDDPPTEDLATDPLDPVRVAAAAARVDAGAAVRWMRDNASAYGIDPNRIAVAGYSAGAVTALGVAYWEPGVQHEDVQAVFSLSGGLYGSEDQLEAGEPPLILIHGENDHARPESEAMAARAELVGVTHEVYEIPGVDHDTPPVLGTVVDGLTLRDHVARFFYDQLGLGAL